MDNKQLLLQVLINLAPSGDEQSKVTTWFNEMFIRVFKENETNQHKIIVKTLANTTADGLNHGNWPWSV